MIRETHQREDVKSYLVVGERDVAIIDTGTGAGDDPGLEASLASKRRRERQTRVQESLLQLDPDSRLVILLHDYHGFDHAEIAETVGISHASARKRYSRAIAILAPLL